MSKKTMEPSADQLREALRERTEQLETVTHELEKFSYSVSHDLRAPLRAIEGFAKIVLEDYADKLDEDGQRFLKIIDASSRKMTCLLDDLLLFSRLGRQEMKPVAVDMKELISSIWEELKPSAPRKVDFNLKSLPDAWGDAALLRQIWTQLLENSLKFTALKEHGSIEISGKKESGRLVYCIKDNGVGFDMKSADKLFGVFQRLHTEDEFEGSGIGLAIVQRLVRRHSGKVWTEAKLNEGAVFSFTLPPSEDRAGRD